VRFIIGQFAHESNDFCANTSGEKEFRELELLWGRDVLDAHRGKHTVLGGYMEVMESLGHQLIGSVSAIAVPSGTIEAGFYTRIKKDLLTAVADAGKVDGVLLHLHGAMCVEESLGIFDPEGDIVASVRHLVGAHVPIAVVFDLHSDTSEMLLKNLDISLAYNEEPHRDGYDRAMEAAGLVLRILTGEIHPVKARERVPMLLPAINMATDHGPRHELHQLRAELEHTTGVLDISIHPGFYGADQPEVGFSVVCTTDNDPDLAVEMCRKVAQAAWKKREEFLVDLVSVEDAVRRAMAATEPIGLIDEADDPAGGGTAESVFLLRGMLAGGITSGGVSTINDPEVVRQMTTAGVGTSILVTLGGKSDSLHGEPIEVNGRVVQIFTESIPFDNWSRKKYNVGPIGVLDVGGILVVVTSQKIISENIDIFEILGYDVRRMQVVAFKGLGLHIRQALAGKIKIFLPIDGVGVTHPDVRKLGPYKRVKRPVWPLDEIPMEAYPGS
jgi:microcystin degradation protein MlrC